MTTEKKLVSGVVKLIWMTHDREITWERTSPPEDLVLSCNGRIVVFFGAQVHDKKVGLFEEVQFLDEVEPPRGHERQAGLALFTTDWKLEWVFPDLDVIDSLLEAVRRRSASVESFLDSLVGEDEAYRSAEAGETG
ncbi:MAG: hypothetical protein AB1646_01445 [Thermodesulfobacteriota bacterium]